jgi:hypothetical protein
MLKKSAIKETVEKFKIGDLPSKESSQHVSLDSIASKNVKTEKKLRRENFDLIGQFLPRGGEIVVERFKSHDFEISQLMTGVDLKPEKAQRKEKPLLKVKKIEEIHEKKPEELIEPLIKEKKDLTFISDLAIPAHKLSKLFNVETSYTEDSLSQILTAWKDPEKIIKWTAKLDKHGREFYSLRGEGLIKMKDNPPIYGMEFDEGAVISTHIGDYTLIMGSHNFDVKSLVKIFAFGIENAKRFNI